MESYHKRSEEENEPGTNGPILVQITAHRCHL